MQREGRVAEQLGAGVSECESGPGERGCGSAAGREPAGVLYSVTRAARLPAALQPCPSSRSPRPAVRSLRCREPARARESEGKRKGGREKERERDERWKEGEREREYECGGKPNKLQTNCKQVCTCMLGLCVLNGRERAVMVVVVVRVRL